MNYITKRQTNPAFNFSTADVKKRFNEFAEANNLQFSITRVDIMKGVVKDVFKCVIANNDDDFTICGTFDKSGKKVTELLTIMDWRSEALRDKFILMMMGFISIVNPALTNDAKEDILNRIGLSDQANNIFNMTGKTNYRGVKYWLSSSPETHIRFGAEALS